MPTADSKRRWYRLSPDRFVVGLLLSICLLWLSQRFQWFGFNHHKGWTVLIAVAAVGVAIVLMLLWWIAGLIFGWRFQFGIRSLLAFCLASSIAVSWLTVEMKAAREQREAVVAITKVRAIVFYDWQVDVEHYYNPLPTAQPPGPACLRNLLGNDLFWTIKRVVWESYESRSCVITDVGLENLRGLKQLEHLSFWGNEKLSDAKLEHLKGLNQLRELWLNSTRITDAGLKLLKGLTQLHTLALEYTSVTDDGLDSLKGLHQLRTLHLVGTRVTAAGVQKLQQALPNCEIWH